MNGKTFRQACCDKLGIPAEAFEETVLRECLYPHGWLLSRLHRRLNRSWLRTDRELIRAVADCTSLSDIRAELDDQYYQHPNSGFLRRALRLRLSRRRLVTFAARFLH